MNWIPITEELPPVAERVLFCCEVVGDFTEVGVGWYTGKWTESPTAVAMETAGDDWAPCSHWMDLPNRPEASDQKAETNPE